jgi:hypothetical protein
MTKRIVHQSPKSATESRSLSYQDVYVCPVCRHGQISTLTLMDAFACNFCRHIFTADLRKQSVQVVDSSQPLSWRWNGRNWQSAYQDDLDLTLVIWLVGIALVVLPPALIWLSHHTFPPLEGSTWDWFPAAWIGLTFLSHFTLVAWLMAEHYQFPIYVACKVRLRDLWGWR